MWDKSVTDVGVDFMLIENIRLLSVVISQDIISSCYFFFIGYEVDKNEMKFSVL